MSDAFHCEFKLVYIQGGLQNNKLLQFVYIFA